MESVKQSVKNFIHENFYVPEGLVTSDGVSLREVGVVDSTGVLELIEFLEIEFSIRVADSEILPENLDSVEAIAAFVERKRALARAVAG
jgi:acyl carrier protein